MPNAITAQLPAIGIDPFAAQSNSAQGSKSSPFFILQLAGCSPAVGRLPDCANAECTNEEGSENSDPSFQQNALLTSDAEKIAGLQAQ